MKAKVGGKYERIREGEIDLKKEEKVIVLESNNGYAKIQKNDGTIGKCPNYFLNIDELPGNSFADQIQYRRNWLEKIDGSKPSTSSNLDLLTKPESFDILSLEMSKCDSPLVLEEMKDIEAIVGQNIQMQPIITSHTNFTITWHGPAIDSKRARIQSNNQNSRLIIENVQKEDIGAYSVIARNDFGVASSVAFLNVLPIPDAPIDLICKIVGDHGIRLKWKNEFGMKYCIEFRHPQDPSNSFEIASTNIVQTHVELRNFLRDQYIFRVFSYNQRVRSEPSKCICVDFEKNIIFDCQ